MNARPLIEAQGLSVCVGSSQLLHDVSFRVHAGERVALVGHNGAGKSTLLRVLSGFIPVAQGQLQVLECALAKRARGAALRHLRSRVAQVHQGLHLVNRLSAMDNVLIGAASRHPSALSWLRQWPAAERHAAQCALERVGMGWAAQRRTDALSGGERQKVAMARAWLQLANPGSLLLADEPTASLDADAAHEVLELLSGVVTERRATLICVVHDLDLLPRMAERVLLLRQGVLVADQAVTPQTPAQLRGWLR